MPLLPACGMELLPHHAPLAILFGHVPQAPPPLKPPPPPPHALQSGAAQQRVAAALQRAAHDPAASNRRYLAVAAPPHSSLAGGPDAVVLLRRGADAADLLEAYCAALLLAWSAQLPRQAGAWPAAAQPALADVPSWLAAGRQQGASGQQRGASRAAGGPGGGGFPAFVAALAAAGWAVDRLTLLQGSARLAWGPAELRSD